MAERDAHRGSRASVPVQKIDFTRRRSLIGVPVVARAPFDIFPRLEVAQFFQLLLVLGLRIVFLFCHLSIPVINPSLSEILLNDRSAYPRLRLTDQEGRSRAKSCAARSLWSSQGKMFRRREFPFGGGFFWLRRESEHRHFGLILRTFGLRGLIGYRFLILEVGQLGERRASSAERS